MLSVLFILLTSPFFSYSSDSYSILSTHNTNTINRKGFFSSILSKAKISKSFYQNQISVLTYSKDNLLVLDIKGSLSLIRRDNTIEWKIQLYKNKKYTNTALVHSNNHILCVIDNILYNIDYKTGNINWTKEFRGIISGAPVLDSQNSRISILTLDNYLYVVDCKSGVTIWSYQDVDTEFIAYGTAYPAVDKDIIVAPFANASIKAFQLIDGKILWSYKILSVNNKIDDIMLSAHIPPVIFGNNVLVSGKEGDLINLDIYSGESKWMKKAQISSLISVNRKNFLITDKNSLSLMNAKTGNIIWNTNLNLKTNDKHIKYSNPFIIKNEIFISSNNGLLFKIDLGSGEILKIKKTSFKAWNYSAIIDNFLFS